MEQYIHREEGLKRVGSDPSFGNRNRKNSQNQSRDSTEGSAEEEKKRQMAEHYE